MKIGVLIAAIIATPTMASACYIGHPVKRSETVLHHFQKTHPCPSTGRTRGACPGYVKDHIIPLCAGGPDEVANLQWQTVAAAEAKDVIERQVCGFQRWSHGDN